MHLIDTHSHLDFPDFDEDREEVVRRAVEAGVGTIVTVGIDSESNKRSIDLAEKFPNVYAAVGIHPNEAMNAPEEFCEELRALAKHPRVAAIGECGLDYHRLPSRREKSPFENVARSTVMQNPEELERRMADDAVKNRQAIVFQQQLDLAVELGLNVIIHQRDSWDDTLKMLEPYHGKLRAVFHCFGQGTAEAREVIEKNHLVSFTGIVTFKNAQQVQEAARDLPARTFMVETDCPFLAPMPHRGERCEPAHTRIVAEKIAELRKTSLAEVAEMTTAAACSFFRFPKD